MEQKLINQFKEALGDLVVIDETDTLETCLPFSIPFTIDGCCKNHETVDEQIARYAKLVIAAINGASVQTPARIVKITASSDEDVQVRFEVFVLFGARPALVKLDTATAHCVSCHTSELSDAMCELYGMARVAANQITDYATRCFLANLFAGTNKQGSKNYAVYDKELYACNAAIGVLTSRLLLSDPNSAQSTRARKCIELIDEFLARNEEQKQIAYRLRLIGFACSTLDYRGDEIGDMVVDIAVDTVIEDNVRKANALAVGMLGMYFEEEEHKYEAHEAYFNNLLQVLNNK